MIFFCSLFLMLEYDFLYSLEYGIMFSVIIGSSNCVHNNFIRNGICLTEFYNGEVLWSRAYNTDHRGVIIYKMISIALSSKSYFISLCCCSAVVNNGQNAISSLFPDLSSKSNSNISLYSQRKSFACSLMESL